jgi:hypothetical protein
VALPIQIQNLPNKAALSHDQAHPPIKRLIRPSERLLSRLSGFLVDAFRLGRGARFIQVMRKTSILASMVKFVEYQPMDVESLKKQVQLMRVLVAGCKKHPAYRAIRPATGNCEPCVKMWKARLELNDMEKQC